MHRLNLWLLIVSNAAMAQTSTDLWGTDDTNIWNLNSGNVGIGTTAPSNKLSVAGNVDISANLTMNSGGIAFPAMQLPSSNRNPLSDYQEGSWTPILIGSGGGIASYLYQQASYIKIGRLVFVQIYLQLSNVSTLSGALSLGTLPFMAQGPTSVFNAVSVAYWSNLHTPPGAYAVTAFIPAQSFTITLMKVTDPNVNPIPLNAADLNNATQLIVGGSYIADR